jgi:radical S-adenosyl methionine domain-containing protein 2
VPPDINWYLDKVQLVRNAGIRLKINTVVHRLNVKENMASFIRMSQPERWKLFQVLPVKGQNDGKVESLLITETEFEDFLQRHKELLRDQTIIPESNDAMTGSYLMVDPAGRFYDNVDGEHRYSRPIVEVGIKEALSGIRFSANKFEARSGDI